MIRSKSVVKRLKHQNVYIRFKRKNMRAMNTDITIKMDGSMRLYENQHGYIHCTHENKELIPVSTSFGNISYVCESCGEVVKKDLMPTAL